jgi:hypothetical protein
MRIADEYLQCSVYIYPDEASAKAGKWAGGSGFLVHSEWMHAGKLSTADFVVTNRHVLKNIVDRDTRTPADPIVRLNRRDGASDPIRTNRLRWKNHPAGDDIAALRFEALSDEHECMPVDGRAFLTPMHISHENIGIGDDVAMIGRLVGHDGNIRNSPTARFGVISMMPGDKFENEFGHQQESFLVDCPSISGFSGSPVFLFPPSSARSPEALLDSRSWLLGIDWMHVSHKEPVLTSKGEKVDGLYVNANSGIAGVIPAWRIKELLDLLKTPGGD